jgi:thiamine biosynthesis lipoprotein
MKLMSLALLTSIGFSACKQSTDDLIKISGEAQGTTYHISYYDDNDFNYKASVDSLFKKIDSSLSTYLPASIISRINRNEKDVLLDDHFINVFNKSVEISKLSNGAFDITVAPVINAWGFGFSKKEKVDSTMIDSLLQLVGYEKVKLQSFSLIKEQPGVMLDFNAIAQGYTVDVITNYFESKGMKDFFIELGGEVRAKGVKINNEEWKVGIDKPVEDSTGERTLQAIIKLQNRSLATSGNYRKFYVESGQKFSHIVDPKTGYPAKNNLLSVSVVAYDCMTADAFATAFMVMGLERAKEFLTANAGLNLEVFFIYDDKGEWKTYTSGNLKNRMEVLH